jgi:trans-aconitate methyltransferase
VRWDAHTYDTGFAFVTEYGASLLDLLPVQPPASVLDIGCGTGTHAGALRQRGFQVVGVDRDEAMVRRASQRHPDVEFLTADVVDLDLGRRFDAALSNAALHWMPDQAAALGAVRRHLREGAALVAEMGGKGNVRTVDHAIVSAVVALGLPEPRIRKFFPSVAQQAGLLEDAGFDVTTMWAFARPTRLGQDQTPADWSRLFRADVWARVPSALHAEFAQRIDAGCADLHDADGWLIDYHRLRFVAVAV